MTAIAIPDHIWLQSFSKRTKYYCNVLICPRVTWIWLQSYLVLFERDFNHIWSVSELRLQSYLVLSLTNIAIIFGPHSDYVCNHKWSGSRPDGIETLSYASCCNIYFSDRGLVTTTAIIVGISTICHVSQWNTSWIFIIEKLLSVGIGTKCSKATHTNYWFDHFRNHKTSSKRSCLFHR